MNAFLATIRAVYLLAAIVLFGELAFRWCVERAVLRRLRVQPAAAWLASRPRFAIQAAALAAVFLASVAWFLAQVQVMSGAPLASLTREMLQGALLDTGFGRVSLARFGLAIALAGALAILRKAAGSKLAPIAAGVAALGLLCSVAWTGHANGDQGQSRFVHLSSDVAHLVAAAAWLGALPTLAFILSRTRRDASARALDFAAQVAGRFSAMGIAAVTALALTGIVNAWYTVGSLAALVGTNYGLLLSSKVLLFVAMLALAATNRFRHTPRLLQSKVSAQAARQGAIVRLGLNAAGEIALGVAVVGIAAVLGTSTPAAHGQTLWPFPYTLSFEAASDNGLATAICMTVLAASILLAAGIRRRRLWALGAALAALSVQLSVSAVPATPTTYLRSPARYSAESIASGARLYTEQCSICHGPQGHGDGLAAAELEIQPANLTEHVLHHRQGDVFWWIKEGIPGTPMPAIDGRVSERQIWDLINLLRTQAEAEEAKPMASAVKSWAVEAPDFIFQIDRDGQESLADQRGHASVLLVLFDPAESTERLRALSEYRPILRQAGLRVIAIPTRADGASAENLEKNYASIIAGFDREIATAYALLAPQIPDRGAKPELKHAEFMIDRQGCIRARWAPNSGGAWLQMPYLMRQLLAMDRGQPQACSRHDDGHVH